MGCREQGLFHCRARPGPASSWSHPGDQTPLVDKPSGPSILRPLSPCEQLSPSASHSQGLLLPPRAPQLHQENRVPSTWQSCLPRPHIINLLKTSPACL